MQSNYYKLLILVFLSVTPFLKSYGQELVAPAKGKSMVYFFRSSGTGALINFKYFDGEDYLGKFAGKSCFTYECEPGEHIFWVSAENRDFVKATLLPDKIYMIEARPTMGMVKAAVKLFPIEKDNEKAMKKVSKFLVKNQSKPLDAHTYDRDEIELQFFIANGMKRYNMDKEKGKLKILSSDMYLN